jgi:hypothetical protein
VFGLVEPNFGLFLWILLVMWLLDAVAHIVLGLLGEEQRQKYGAVDVVSGIICLVLALIVLLT